MYIRFVVLILVGLAAVPGKAAGEEGPLRPYVLASTTTGTVTAQTEVVSKALTAQGFEVTGQYTPYDGAAVLVVTSPALLEAAAQSEHGGYGAAQRVSITEVDGQIQVAYTNPLYMANVYRMASQLEGVAADLEVALGRDRDFGSKKGHSAEKLRKYHYTVMMPYFDDQDVLAEYNGHAQAVAAVEAGLGSRTGGTELICRVDIPGKDEVLFCVGLREGHGRDEVVIDNCDRAPLKHTAYLPYEMLVSGTRVLALHGKFRIALSFPDLSMGTFMKISRAPGGISNALEAAAGGS